MSAGIGAVVSIADVPATTRRAPAPEFAPQLQPAGLPDPGDQAFQVDTINERLHSIAQTSGLDPAKLDLKV